MTEQVNFRIGEAAKYLGNVSEQLLRKLHRRGQGPARSRVGPKLIVYSKHALDEWLAAQTDVSTARPQ
jgi:predicted DNA-binding transcriptional regulator AlpA